MVKFLIQQGHCCTGKRHVKWFNMREEPVLYINGNPYVVREASKPFANLEITGELPLGLLELLASRQIMEEGKRRR